MATKKKTPTTAPVVEEQTKAPVVEEQTKTVETAEELTQQQHMNLFRAIIDCYGVQASYGYPQRMAIIRPFCDFFGVFGEKGKIYTQTDIAPFWKAVVFGQWKCPLDNPFVKVIKDTIDWDKI